jgi:cellulose synthase/poly-beta-1,6-N-acetylglucosamine synthase-like glycosyltransferase
MDYFFWALVGILFYTYAGYPLLAFALGGIRKRAVVKGPHEPTVTIIIAAHNEAAHIGGTIANKLDLDYPRAKLQIIVVSDGSIDGTDDIVRGYTSRGVVYLRQERRQGKTAALNLAATRASGEVLVFADANSMYASDVLRSLVRNFRDPGVGYVTGRLVYVTSSQHAVGMGSRAYMAYEDLLRRSETHIGSIVGVNGGIDAVRASLYQPMRADQLPDFVLPLSVVGRGYRVVYEPDAVLTEESLSTSRSEYRMRVRVALRAWCALADMRSLFSVRRHGLFAIQLFSHKALRYLAFVALPLCYAAALVLAPGSVFYQWVIGAGAVSLLLAAIGGVLERRGRSTPIVSIPYYFLLINAAAGHALIKFLWGERQTLWQPRLG